MPRASRFSELSPAGQTVLRPFQSINYGYREDLLIGGGDLVLSAESVVLIDLKLDTERDSRPERDELGFLPMELLDRIQEGKISRITGSHTGILSDRRAYLQEAAA